MNGKEQHTLIMSAANVQELLSTVGLDSFMDGLIKRLDYSIETFDETLTVIPARSGFNYELPRTGLIEWMPLYQYGSKVMLKVVGYHPTNPTEYGQPTILSTISSYNTENGHLEALVDGVLATALRTGAASTVASKKLAHPDSKILGLIGCGVQSVTQLHALSRAFSFEKVLIYDVDPGAMYSFSERAKPLGLSCEIVFSDIEAIVEEVDILCTATSIDIGAGPLFNGVESKPHLHINAVGSDFPGKVEVPFDFLNSATVCPDFLEQAIVEGECQQLAPESIGPQLHEIIKNSASHKNLKNERTVFDSTGWALEDEIVIEYLLELNEDLQLGQLIQIESMPIDSKSPYEFLLQPSKILTAEAE